MAFGSLMMMRNWTGNGQGRQDDQMKTVWHMLGVDEDEDESGILSNMVI